MRAAFQSPSPWGLCQQDELPLSSVRPHVKFPGRTTLYVHEIASALQITGRHVLDLISEGKIQAVNIAGKNNATAREFWRVPVSEYDRYLRENSNVEKSRWQEPFLPRLGKKDVPY